jgi:hypothetical protein
MLRPTAVLTIKYTLKHTLVLNAKCMHADALKARLDASTRIITRVLYAASMHMRCPQS